jgi:hydrogenase nickel incorporation protein HypA/HybF
MHEISLVRNIFGALKSEIEESKWSFVRKIHLRAGILSNIEPVLMQNAFEAVIATENKVFANSSLEIEILPIKVHCMLCDSTSTIQNYKFICDSCENPCNNVIQGNELTISGVEVEDDS